MEYRRHTLNSYDEENPCTTESWTHPEHEPSHWLLWFEFKKLIYRCLAKRIHPE